ncbi:MAG: hypothetical protein UX86_C0010G0030 [Candidatus Amesbacteria bacterium GW2011_GWC1_47_15]|uniref:Ribosomal RNA methyltransferase FtsJ domain-containing protein n=1 Tax=Candidatus Amesbacteria bacterium GW2011_GWC1_47_15 TaxID=1618364 RepID=A0A0G1V2V6_9BACT|nr:MAG: hypothetical protein UX86_C0010G0030 [Candidatus Amesbacteria bacterium GW2011_GWC1_47_15]
MGNSGLFVQLPQAMDIDRHFVSRAGYKLQHALDTFGIGVTGKICADLGSSTGGFTDCLLQNGAARIYSIDTAYGQLDWHLRNDPRVVILERTNALHAVLPEKVSFVSCDVGWTTQRLILPAALSLLSVPGDVVSLLKPHYEIKKSPVSVVFAHTVLDQVIKQLADKGIRVKQAIPSPLAGQKGGNPEFLLWIPKS